LQSLRFRDSAAANANDDVSLALHDPLQRKPFKSSVDRLAIQEKYLGQIHSCICFNLAIELNEAAVQFVRQRDAKGAFAGSPQACQGYSLVPDGLLSTKSFDKVFHGFAKLVRWQTIDESADELPFLRLIDVEQIRDL
jgi:hypothetical protein